MGTTDGEVTITISKSPAKPGDTKPDAKPGDTKPDAKPDAKDNVTCWKGLWYETIWRERWLFNWYVSIC